MMRAGFIRFADHRSRITFISSRRRTTMRSRARPGG